MHNQLPGYPITPNSKRSSAWLLIAALLCAAAFVAVRYAGLGNDSGVGTGVKPSTDLNFTAAEAKELRRHLDSAAVAQDEAAAAMNKSQLWLDRTMAAIEYDPVAGRRVQLARAAQASAATEISRAREELQIMNNLLAERTGKQ